ncbi:ethanolamine ammonia-lyase small subunit [Variovorax sp. GrIS 2.14]|uniref:ethanolamine ammonia-lyase light chain EutC n=1 Tax=Variovorax sp. GrIS 2.14 TaxID=3071709 RepID=UPI0038F6D7FB
MRSRAIKRTEYQRRPDLSRQFDAEDAATLRAKAAQIAEAHRAEVCIVIGERPDLSSPDSLGIYLTHSPKRGRHDAERNCISNLRPEGLAYDVAAFQLACQIRESLRQGMIDFSRPEALSRLIARC